MKRATDLKTNVNETANKAKKFLGTPQGKAVGALAVLAALGTAAMIIKRSRRAH